MKGKLGDDMKIIKPGTRYGVSINPKHTFCCKQCGCEFEADSSEYKAASQIAYIHDGIVAKCKCPSCSATRMRISKE